MRGSNAGVWNDALTERANALAQFEVLELAP
jgi:hypothetical protein